VLGDSVTAGALPVPLSAIPCGLFAALSVIDTLAVRLPPPVGENVTDTVQLAPTASVEGLSGQFEVCAKSPALVPVIPIAVIANAALPEFVTVALCDALLVPSDCEPNTRLAGLTVTAGAGATPVPLSPTVCGEPGALSLIETLAPLLPEAVGANVTEIAQLLFAASVAGLTGQFDVCEKSPLFVPVIPMLLIVSAAVPELVTVTVLAALVVPVV
jgi:hypothetical protein